MAQLDVAPQPVGALQFVLLALKAPRRITHIQKLQDAGDSVSLLFDAAAAFGPKLGPVLFGLPPSMQRDQARLTAFLATLPPGRQIAWEFRNPGWFDDGLFATLRAHGAALCIAETDEGHSDAPPVATAGAFCTPRTRSS